MGWRHKNWFFENRVFTTFWRIFTKNTKNRNFRLLENFSRFENSWKRFFTYFSYRKVVLSIYRCLKIDFLAKGRFFFKNHSTKPIFFKVDFFIEKCVFNTVFFHIWVFNSGNYDSKTVSNRYHIKKFEFCDPPGRP